jgi:hypothetical protein
MKTMRFRYGQAVDEQKQKLWEYKKKVKVQTQLPHVELLPTTIEPLEEDLPQAQSDSLEPIKA